MAPGTAEFRKLFPQYDRKLDRKSKPKGRVGMKLFFQPKTTFTATVCALDTTYSHTPSPEHMKKLKAAGLGKEKICFPNKEADHDSFFKQLLQRFPKLEAAHGRLLLYKALGTGSQRRLLEKIPPGPCGYTITFLREKACIGSACIYIMPIQTNIPLDKVDNVLDISTMPMVKCVKCSTMIPLIDMNEHSNVCLVGDEHDSADEFASMNTSKKHRTSTVVEIDSDECDVPELVTRRKTSNDFHQQASTSKETSAANDRHGIPEHLEYCPICSKLLEATYLPTHVERSHGVFGGHPTSITHAKKSFTDSSYSSFVAVLEDQEEMFKERMGEIQDSQSTTGYEQEDVDVGVDDVKEEERLRAYVAEYTQEQIKGDSTAVSFVIMRTKLMKSLKAALKRLPKFQFDKPLKVEFIGEEAIDEGGPLREFSRLYLKEITESSGLLEGRADARVFTCAAPLLHSRSYEEFGKMFAYAVALGGPSMNCLHPSVYEYLVGLPIKPEVSANDIPDMEERARFTQVYKAQTNAEYHKALEPLQDWALSHGLGRMMTYGIEKKTEFLEALWKDIVIYRRSAAITQFLEGLQSTAILSAIKHHPPIWRLLFVNSPKIMTRQMFKELCKYEMSTEGSNLYEAEKQTILTWEILLQDIEDRKFKWSFPDILIYMTGADRVPPVGFHKKISIGFYTRSSPSHYPSASTCDLHLLLPRGIESVDELEKLIMDGISLCGGFGKI